MKCNCRRLRRPANFLIVLLVLLPVAPLCAQNSSLIDSNFLLRGNPPFPWVWRPYQQTYLPPPNLRNGPTLTQMIHEGKLELSLNDMLRLTAENELDLEADRYTYLIAQTDILRSKSGQAARGLPTAPVPGGLFFGAIGAGVGSNANVSTAGTGAAAISGAAKAVVVGPRGTFDPTFSTNFSFDRVQSPLNTTRVAGIPLVNVASTVLQTRYQQELPTGTSFSLSFNLQRQGSSQAALLFNPAFQSYFSFQVYQPLLNGFGLSLNHRFITFTENNRRVSLEVFSQQLNDSLSNAAGLYWDFVALTDQVKVARQEVQAAQTLYQNNLQQQAAGTMAALDVVQSESQLAASRRDLVVAQTNLQMQEVKIKSAISKAIGKDLDQATIEPSDALPEAAEIKLPSLTGAVESAMRSRASVREAELQVENQKIAEEFTHNNLLPTLSAFVAFNSYSLANGTNAMLRQMAQWVYPEFSVGFTLTFSLFNRAAQADDTRARLEFQQAQVTLDQTKSQVGLAVRSALVALIQSRAQIQAAELARSTSQETLRGQQVRYANGLATPYDVILAQRDLATAQLAEIQVRVNAAKAQVALEVAMGTLLSNHGVPFDNALRGDVFTGSIPSRNASTP